MIYNNDKNYDKTAKAVTPCIFSQDYFVDDRGSFKGMHLPNGYDSFESKRIYVVSNFKRGFVRAFHGHKIEKKIIICISGAVRVAAIPMDCVDINQYKGHKTFILDASVPRALYIPAGYYNGWQSLTEDAKILVISSSTLDESKDDDFRKDPMSFGDLWKDEWR